VQRQGREEAGANGVDDQVRAGARAHPAELAGGEAGEDENGADELQSRSHDPLHTVVEGRVRSAIVRGAHGTLAPLPTVAAEAVPPPRLVVTVTSLSQVVGGLPGSARYPR
jgi:hypothetical protein